MRELGIDLLFSCVPQDVVPTIYGRRLPGVDVRTTLAGFVPDQLVGRPVPPLRGAPDRRRLPRACRSVLAWAARTGQVEIARGFLARAAATDLRYDISWTESAVSTASAGSVSSRRAEPPSALRAAPPSSTSMGRSRAACTTTGGTPGRDVRRGRAALLHAYEGRAVINVISPRVFEAAVLRTALVLFPGNYSGVVEAWTHYIPLEHDFSNFDEVVERLRDVAFLVELTDRARRPGPVRRVFAAVLRRGSDHAATERAMVRDSGLPRSVAVPVSSCRPWRAPRRPGEPAARRTKSGVARRGRRGRLLWRPRHAGCSRHARPPEAAGSSHPNGCARTRASWRRPIAAQRGRVTTTTASRSCRSSTVGDWCSRLAHRRRRTRTKTTGRGSSAGACSATAA